MPRGSRTVVAPRFAGLVLMFLIIAVGLGSSGSPVAASSGSAADAGLVAAYSFNEGTGSTVGDASGTGNDGTIEGATWSTSGKHGGALEFDGTAKVTIADAPSLRLTTGMTLEAWVYPTSTSSGCSWKGVSTRTRCRRRRGGPLSCATIFRRPTI